MRGGAAAWASSICERADRGGGVLSGRRIISVVVVAGESEGWLLDIVVCAREKKTRGDTLLEEERMKER